MYTRVASLATRDGNESKRAKMFRRQRAQVRKEEGEKRKRETRKGLRRDGACEKEQSA